MAEAVAHDYAAVATEAGEALGLDDVSRARTLRRLRRELGRVRQRDFFPPAERETAQQAVEALASTVANDNEAKAQP